MAMKTPSLKPSRVTALALKTLALIGAFIAIFATRASALPPTSRHMTGIIEKVDPSARTLVVQAAAAPHRVQLAWNERTRFVEEARFTTPAAMHAGRSVIVTFRSPFFGPPFATKVVVASSNARPQAKAALQQNRSKR